ncbi:MAG: CvpA family protein [Bacteroidales bacterium]
MSGIDIIFLIILGIAFVSGLFKGLVRQLASLSAIIAGIGVSYFFANEMLSLLEQLDIFSPQLVRPASFVVTFLITVIIINFIAHLISKGVHLVGLTPVDKLAGALFSMLKWVLLLSIFLNLYQTIDQNGRLLSDDKKKLSYLYSPIQKILPTCFPYVKDYLQSNQINLPDFLEHNEILSSFDISVR